MFGRGNVVCIQCMREYNISYSQSCPHCGCLGSITVREGYEIVQCDVCGNVHSRPCGSERVCPSCHHSCRFEEPYEAVIEEVPPGIERKSAFDTQVGGAHYKKYAIQPAEYCQKNKLNHCESSIVKYATRHQDKNGAEDVKKIIHYAKMILELSYGETYSED